MLCSADKDHQSDLDHRLRRRGLFVVGILAVMGGNYDKQVVHDQLVPQKIFFPAAGSPTLLPGIKQYAGQQLVNGAQVKAYANNFINVPWEPSYSCFR
jgi:hypothetical protein